MSQLDPYKILSLPREASWEEIRQAYRRAATKYHPDAGGDAWAFQQVQQAYKALRTEYEKTLGANPTSTSSPRPQPTQPQPRNHSQTNSNQFNHSQTKNSHQQAQAAAQNPKNHSTSPNKSVGLTDWLFGRPLKLHNETSYFVFANFMDVVMTVILLRFNATEANPIANYFLQHFGIIGMMLFKLLIVLAVCAIAQWISHRSVWKARLILVGGTFIVAGVVVYSMFLARFH